MFRVIATNYCYNIFTISQLFSYTLQLYTILVIELKVRLNHVICFADIIRNPT